MNQLKFTLEQLDKKSSKRPQGFKKEVLDKSIKLDEQYFQIDMNKFKHIDSKYRIPARLEMFRSLITAAHVFLSPEIQKLERRSDKEINACAAICSDCDYLIEEKMRCGKCGCFLRLKMQLKDWHCPLKKW